MAFAGLVLVFAGLVFWAVSRYIAGGEAHSFSPGAVAPTYVHVTGGHTYSVDVPGGAKAVAHQGRPIKSVTCTVNEQDQAPTPLQLTLETNTTKATNQIGTFVATGTALVHVACPGLTPVFVDNADGLADDSSGPWLVIASIALAIGIPLTLSVLRRPGRFGRPVEAADPAAAPAAVE